ncbi:MAG: aldo/keto reductase [Gemmatimonadetes bacterium]|nr:aldo/keto reductase [Gemmatimonadota bacterium]
MDYVPLGNSGVKVSRVCLGTAFRGQADDDVAVQTIETSIELGCNFIDCANFYGRGRSERILARAIRGKRDDLFLTTKVWSKIGDGPNDLGLSRYHIMREVERSLTRLGTDHIDLYLLHNWDGGTPLEESLRAMDDLVRQGKVLYVGACNFSTAQVLEALWTSDRGGWDRFVCLQNQYNLLHRLEVEPEMLPAVRKYGLGLMTYSPLAVGLLTGRFRRGQPAPEGTPWTGDRFERVMTERVEAVVAVLVELGQQLGKTPAQLAMAWLLDHEEVTAPIVGPDMPEHVEETFAALDGTLPAEVRQRLDEVSLVEPPARYDRQ